MQRTIVIIFISFTYLQPNLTTTKLAFHIDPPANSNHLTLVAAILHYLIVIKRRWESVNCFGCAMYADTGCAIIYTAMQALNNFEI